MNSLTSKFSKLGLLILLISGLASAQNINDALRLATPGLGANARALGMGNSYISLSDDASAAFFNPAGFGLLKRIEFSGGLSYQGAGNTTTFFNQSTDYDNSTTRLDRISFAFPFPTTRGSLVFGLSYHNTKDFTGAMKFDGFNAGNSSLIQNLNIDSNIPFDLFLTDEDYNTPINGRLQQSGSILTEGGINNWTLSGAIEVYKNIFVGANLNIISGSFESNNEYYEDDVNGLYQGQIDPGDARTTDFRTFYLNRILNWDLGGWDAKIGFLYQLKNNARFGVTVQFPKSFSIEETFDVSGYSQFANNSFDLASADYSDKVEYDIITPYELSAGFSFNYAGLIFSAEGTLIDYSQTEFDGEGDGLSTSYITSLNKDIKDQLTAVINYNLGLEYTIPTVGLRLRGGFIMQPSAYKDDPSEFNRKYLTAGIGFLTDETIGIDLGYAHGWWNDIGDNYGSNVSRTSQEVTTDKVIITATYRF
jgi:long-subunit fatty acid transport protein